MLKILIVDDHPMFRESLSAILQKQKINGKVPKIWLADSATSALKIIHKNMDLDIIMADIDMPGMNGLDLLKKIQPLLPNTTIVIISGSENNTDVQKALNLGAKGFIQKNSETPVLLAALNLILAGGSYIPPLILKGKIPSMISVNNMEQPTLTARQMEILSHLHQGKQNKIIAYELDLSEATIKVHVRHIFSVLGVKNRTQAVERALHLGIL